MNTFQKTKAVNNCPNLNKWLMDVQVNDIYVKDIED